MAVCRRPGVARQESRGPLPRLVADGLRTCAGDRAGGLADGGDRGGVATNRGTRIGGADLDRVWGLPSRAYTTPEVGRDARGAARFDRLGLLDGLSARRRLDVSSRPARTFSDTGGLAHPPCACRGTDVFQRADDFSWP